MKYYMDKTYIAADHTILSYCAEDAVVNVPDRLGDMPIHTIGMGAFWGSVDLERLVLGPEITRIEKDALRECVHLKQLCLTGNVQYIQEQRNVRCERITISDLELSQEQYHALMGISRCAQDGIWVCTRQPELELVKKLLKAFSIPKPACEIPWDIDVLFMAKDSQVDLQACLPQFLFCADKTPLTEDAALMARIHSGVQEQYDREAEQKNDSLVRKGKIPEMANTWVFTVDDRATYTNQGKYYISLSMVNAVFFYQSPQPVVHNGRTYFVYRRMYLNGDPELRYSRQDVAVYTLEGMVPFRLEAQEVYEKYTLLSIL